MKVFVTGGNGFIGSYVVKELLKNDHQVHCLLREKSKTSRIDSLHYKKCMGDVLNKKSFVEGMKGCDAIIHLASISNWADIHDPAANKIVIEGTENVLQAAIENGNLPVVYFSSATAIGCSKTRILLNEASPFNLKGQAYSYAIAKNEAEKICQKYHKLGLRVVIVNPTEVYGPNDIDKVTCGSLIDFIKETPVFVTDGGTSIVHVEDVARGAIAALEKGRSGERYILGGDSLTVRQLAEFTLNIVNLKKKIILLPNFAITSIAAIAKMLKIPLPFNPEIIPYAIRYWMMDNSKAKKELGVNFRDAKDVLTPTIQWLAEAKMI